MSPLRTRLSERLGLFTVHRVSNYKCEQSLCSCLRNLACRLEWCALFFETEFSQTALVIMSPGPGKKNNSHFSPSEGLLVSHGQHGVTKTQQRGKMQEMQMP